MVMDVIFISLPVAGAPGRSPGCRGACQPWLRPPELVFFRLIALILAKGHRLSILHRPDMYFGRRPGPISATGSRRAQHDNLVPVGQDVVDRQAECALRKLHEVLEES